MSWQRDHIIEWFEAWGKVANVKLWLFVENVEKNRWVGSIFGNQFHFLLMCHRCCLSCLEVTSSLVVNCRNHWFTVGGSYSIEIHLPPPFWISTPVGASDLLNLELISCIFSLFTIVHQMYLLHVPSSSSCLSNHHLDEIAASIGCQVFQLATNSLLVTIFTSYRHDYFSQYFRFIKFISHTWIYFWTPTPYTSDLSYALNFSPTVAPYIHRLWTQWIQSFWLKSSLSQLSYMHHIRSCTSSMMK